MEKLTEALVLQKTVLDGDYCIGCGACALVQGTPFKIKMNEFGNYVAYQNTSSGNNTTNNLLSVCPFSGVSKNENELCEIFFPNNIKDNFIGSYLKCFAGFVSEGEFRIKGSSGGFGKWMGYILLKENLIDYFVQISSNETNKTNVPLFNYKIYESSAEVINGSKSCYYPTTLYDIIIRLKEKNGRYAITGVPCFIKTIRLLSLNYPELKDRILFTIGIFCGGMKSANQAKMISWQLGVHPDNLTSIDFRRKHLNKPASHKIYQVWSSKDNNERFKTDFELFATGWEGYFKPNACDYCDDIVSETADISFGDAWLPEYVQDPMGTSVIIVRNLQLLELLYKYNSRGSIKIEEIPKSQVLKSQEGAFRHRREALSYRIAKKQNLNLWVPKKRVNSNEFKISKKRKHIYNLREKIAATSHISFLKALKNNNFQLFLSDLQKLDKEYKKANHRSIINRVIRKLLRMLHCKK